MRTFGNIQLAVSHVEGEPQGSRITAGDAVWELPQWPSRVADIRATEGGVIVAFKDGRQRLLESSDAITAPAADGLETVRQRIARAFRDDATHEFQPLLEAYLAINGDPHPVDGDMPVLRSAVRRVVTGKGPSTPDHQLEARIIECQQRTNGREVTEADEQTRELHRLTVSLIKHHLLEAEAETRRLSNSAVDLNIDQAEALLEAMGPGKASYPKGTLERVPGKQNWVDKTGGLPRYIERIAAHIHYEKGKTIGHAIAIAVNAVKKMCASGDLNFRGAQQVNPGSRAAACKAVAEWEAKKNKARAQEAAVMEEAVSATHTVYEPFEAPPREEAPSVVRKAPADPLAARVRAHSSDRLLREGEQVAVGELTVENNTHLDVDTLRDTARELYEESGGATTHGREHIRSAGRAELSRIITTLRQMRQERL